jgi:corrinoid protein of di/trimethylamine methyltransferase
MESVMSEEKEHLFNNLADAVVEMDEERTVQLAQEVVARRIDAYQAIDLGLAAGMERAGQLFEEEEYFIPELLICSDAMYAGLAVLRPHLRLEEAGEKIKVVIGVVEGDTHDIGKNLVKILLEAAGFEVADLGRDVPPHRFVTAAQEIGARLIALSTLMTTTMDGMREVVRLLEEDGSRPRFRVIVGGGPISQGFADRIGADGYAANAAEAVKLARRLASPAGVAA